MNFLKWGVILEEFTFVEELGLIPLEKVFCEFVVELVLLDCARNLEEKERPSCVNGS